MEPRDVARIATALGLGSLYGRPTNLKPKGPNPVWAAETSTGRWIIKTTRPPGAWWFEAMTAAGDLEIAARAAGIPTPDPADERGDAGLWHDVSDNVYARAIRRVTGRHPPVPADFDLCDWLGAALAAIERTGLPADPNSDSGYRLHPPEAWDEWISEAVSCDVIDANSATSFAALVVDLNQIIADGRGSPVWYQRLHRDISASNILITPNGPTVLDFDHAGPQVPWWEFVCNAFTMATPALGTIEPSRESVRSALGAYLRAGGQAGSADPAAFTGMLAARLSFAAYQLWISCGHRASEFSHRVQAARGFADAMATLPALQQSVVRWATWLA